MTRPRIWNTITGLPVGKPLLHRGVVVSAIFSADGQHVLTASHDSTARIWNAQSGEPVGAAMKHDNFISSARFSPEGLFVITASRDETARIWNAKTGTLVGSPLVHQVAVYSACFSPDAKWVLTASRDKSARIWDVQTGRETTVSPLIHPDAVYIASFHPDGRLILTVSEDQTVRVWDSLTGRPIGMPLTHQSRVNSACFNHDGTRIVTANEDKSARLWDTLTGQPIGPPLIHHSRLNDARFSPDGTQIVTATDGKTSQIWDIRSLQPIDGTAANIMTDVAAGTHLGEQLGILEPVSSEQRRKLLPEFLSLVHDRPDWSMLIQLDLDSQPDSRISPASTVTRRQAITNLLRSGSSDQIHEAMILDPGHPLLQIALAGLPEYAKQATFLRDYGLNHLPNDPDDCRAAADMLLAQKDELRSRQALQKATKQNEAEPAPQPLGGDQK